jgi:glycosyltransferase involved in cell wall biosynthesis
MKIVHVITCLLRAGAEENTLATCRGQVERGYEVWLMHGREVDECTRAAVPEGVRLVQVMPLLREVHPPSDLAALRRMTRTLREIAPDVVHTHQSKAGFIGRLAARFARVPIILHGVHILPFLNVSPPKRLLYLSMERIVAPFTDGFIAVAKGMHHANLAAGLGTAENNHVVYSGMDLERFRCARPSEEAPPGRMIAFVASLEPRKRHAEFLEIFAKLARRYPDLTLCLLGQGELEPALRDRVAALGLDQQVQFMGFRSDVERWIAAAGLCVLPSMREGLPRVVVQYVAAGRPVVVTRLPGIEEIVEDGVNGFVVEPNRLDEMEKAIDRLLSEPDLAARMADAAGGSDLSRWSISRMEPEIDAIITALALRKGLSVVPAQRESAGPPGDTPDRESPSAFGE